jgi:signal transduction histidine kinase
MAIRVKMRYNNSLHKPGSNRHDPVQRQDFLAVVVRLKQFYPFIRFLGALSIALVLFRFPMHFLEGVLFDARTRLTPTPSVSSQITTIAIDSKTLAALQGEPNARDNTALIAQLKKENSLALVYMDDPTKWVGSLKEKIDFSKEASTAPNFFFTTEQIAPVGQKSHLKLSTPFDNLSLSSAPITRDNISFAGDKITRRILISFEGQLLLQPILANLHNHVINPLDYRGSYEAEGSVFNYIRYHPVGTYKPISYIDVKEGHYPKNYFKNKIVLIGVDTQFNTDDYILTPYSRSPLAMSRLEAQANIIDTLILNNGVVRAPPWLDLLLTVAVAWLTVLIVWSARPIFGIIALFGQATGFILISAILFALSAFWIDTIHPLIAIFVSYYLFIPYRLIVENKRSWEYFQRNKLLTQVEELKTNFLSMMSHDLKTPIARIQGMAELALREPQPLTKNQKEALNTILQSSEELGSFIGSILDLSRIESKEVKLKKSSRDINTLLEEVIKKYEFNAKVKNITIKSQLEPLFSVKVDVDLIRQVFSNLVENAIKYSPDGSVVMIASKEIESRIMVSVSDKGPGIAQDEVDNIFLKFYRSKAAKASPIKGSGLGLYLSKYFVELHDGQIFVDSKPSLGSTFTVQLPLG